MPDVDNASAFLDLPHQLLLGNFVGVHNLQFFHYLLSISNYPLPLLIMSLNSSSKNSKYV